MQSYMELKGTLFLVMGGEKWIIESKVQGLLLLRGLIPRNAVYPIVCPLCSLRSCLYERGFQAGALHPSSNADRKSSLGQRQAASHGATTGTG